MIAHGRALGVIPARGGSKGVPRKNIRPLGGRPLLAWTIEAAQQSTCLDRVILSSDDPEIIAAAQACGCDVPFVRDSALAGDATPTIDVVLDALDRCPGYDWVVLLQPTSPLRTAGDIDAAAQQCVRSAAPACVSVTAAQESPYWMFTLGGDHRMTPVLPAMPVRRQDLPEVFSLNGAVYLARVDWLRERRSFIQPETVAYVMPAQRSIDVDTEADLHQLQLALGK